MAKRKDLVDVLEEYGLLDTAVRETVKLFFKHLDEEKAEHLYPEAQQTEQTDLTLI
jgi:hypothetical protein